MLQHNKSETLTTQLEKIFIEKIESGEWPTDKLIPSVFSLAKEFSVSRTTIHSTLLHLQALGLVYRIAGKGTAVSPSKPIAKITFSGIRNQLHAANWSVNFSVILYKFITCPPHIAVLLNINKLDTILYIERLYRHPETNHPRMLQYSYLHRDYADYIDIEQLNTTSIHAQLHEKNMSAYSIEEWIEASGANEYEAKTLELSIGNPVLVLEELRSDQQNQPFYFTRMVTRSDALRLSFSQFSSF